MHIRALVHRKATSSPWHMKTKGLPRSTPRALFHEGGWRLFRACLAPAYAWAYIQSPLPPPKMLFFRVSCACPRVRSIGWWVHLGVKVGGIHLFPRPPTPRCAPAAKFQVNGKIVIKVIGQLSFSRMPGGVISCLYASIMPLCADSSGIRWEPHKIAHGL